jgi:hypothetical protein
MTEAPPAMPLIIPTIKPTPVIAMNSSTCRAYT